MRFLLGVLIIVLTGGSANAAIIKIEYTGTYSGTLTAGNPALQTSTTTQVGPTPFTLDFSFDTSTFPAFYSDTPSSSRLESNFIASAGSVTGT